jgi:hypothetical protein
MKIEIDETLGEVIRYVVYYMYGTDDSHGAERFITIKLNEPGDNFIELKSIEHDTVLAWAESIISPDEIKQQIAEELNGYKLITLDRKTFPWA